MVSTIVAAVVNVLCAVGYRPVINDAIDALVYGACAIASSTTIDSRANASMAGDVGRAYPYAPR
jgi:hypothetical protein